MKNFKVIFTVMCFMSISAYAQFDDIYFNPKTDVPKKEVRAGVNRSNNDVQENRVVLDDNANLTEEDYTYTQRLNAFHNENLLVHIEGNDTTIYDLANGKYQIDVDGKNLDISGVDNYSNSNYNSNPYYGSNYDPFWGWNSWYGMGFYYTPFYSYWGWSASYYNPWYYNSWYYPYHNNCYGCYNPYYPYYPSNGGNSYSDRSNETYRRQNNSEGRYSSNRSASPINNSVGSRNSGTSTNSNVGRSTTMRTSVDAGVTNAGSRSTSTSTSTGSSTRISTTPSSTTRTSVMPSNSGTRSTNTSTSTSSGSRYTGTSSGSSTTTSSPSSGGTRSSGTSSGSSSGGGGSRGGGGGNGTRR